MEHTRPRVAFSGCNWYPREPLQPWVDDKMEISSTISMVAQVNTVEMRPSMVNWALGIEGKRWENRLANMTAKFKVCR